MQESQALFGLFAERLAERPAFYLLFKFAMSVKLYESACCQNTETRCSFRPQHVFDGYRAKRLNILTITASIASTRIRPPVPIRYRLHYRSDEFGFDIRH